MSIKQEIIRDKTGQGWLVEVDEQFGDNQLPLALANFYLFPLGKRSKDDCPNGHAYLSIKGKNASVAKIEDLEIDSEVQDRGLGTALLAIAESWAKSNGVNKLVGDLSNVDADHIKKLEHFYSRNRYTFELSQQLGSESSTTIGVVEKSI